MSLLDKPLVAPPMPAVPRPADVSPDAYTPISIRLPAALIASYKMVAEQTGVGYQALMREVLSQAAPSLVAELLKMQTKDAAE